MNKEKFWRLAFFLLAAATIMGAISYTGLDANWERKYSSIVASDLAVAGVTTVYSDYFAVGPYAGLGIWCQATSVAGTPVVSYTLEFAPKKTAALFSELEGGSGTLSVADENPHNDIVVAKPSNWGRVRVNGVGTNPADTLVDIVINIQK